MSAQPVDKSAAHAPRGRMNVSTGRAERCAALRAEVERCALAAAAWADLADMIEGQSARRAAYAPLWASAAARLREDSAAALSGAERAQDRLDVLAAAEAAAARWIPTRSAPP